MRLLSKVIRPTKEELRASPLVDPDFLAELYHLIDGEPVPESTKHGDEIFYLYDVLRYRFADDPNVFVAQNLLWYFDDQLPRSGLAPDVFVAFGAAQIDRTSFQEWRENEVRPQFVIEVVSPNDTSTDIKTKQLLYKSLGIHLALVLDGFARKITGDELTDDILAESVDYAGRTIPELDLALHYDDDARLVITNAAGIRYPTPTEARRLATEAAALIESARSEVDEARSSADTARTEAERARTEAESAQREAQLLRARLRDVGLKE